LRKNDKREREKVFTQMEEGRVEGLQGENMREFGG
jgi:hypothetical protein